MDRKPLVGLRAWRRARSALCPAVLILPFSSCWTTTASQSPISSAIFVVEVGGYARFRIRITDPERIQEATALIRTRSRASVLGDLAPGDGGFNLSYHWHLVPASVRFAKDRLGNLDVLPNEVEENLDHWLHDIKRYCPSASRIIARER
jgi:hypothetical protein